MVESQEPAMFVYAELLRRQHEAWTAGNIAERDRLFAFIGQFEAEFPEACSAWKAFIGSVEEARP